MLLVLSNVYKVNIFNKLHQIRKQFCTNTMAAKMIILTLVVMVVSAMADLGGREQGNGGVVGQEQSVLHRYGSYEQNIVGGWNLGKNAGRVQIIPAANIVGGWNLGKNAGRVESIPAANNVGGWNLGKTGGRVQGIPAATIIREQGDLGRTIVKGQVGLGGILAREPTIDGLWPNALEGNIGERDVFEGNINSGLSY